MTDDLSVRPWGSGGWSDHTRHLPTPDLPPEPDPPALVRLAMWHPVFGRDPLFERLVDGWQPTGWTPETPFTWAQLCRWNRNLPPAVLDRREVLQ